MPVDDDNLTDHILQGVLGDYSLIWKGRTLTLLESSVLTFVGHKLYFPFVNQRGRVIIIATFLFELYYPY